MVIILRHLFHQLVCFTNLFINCGKRNSVRLLPIHDKLLWPSIPAWCYLERSVTVGEQLVTELQLCPKELILSTWCLIYIQEEIWALGNLICVSPGTPLKALWLVVQEEVDFLMSDSLHSLKLFLWLLGNLICGCWFPPPLSFLLFGVHCNLWNLLQEA